MAIRNVTISEECTACELCVSTCPDVFEMGDEFARVIEGADFHSNEDAIREAAADCPAEAIQIEE